MLLWTSGSCWTPYWTSRTRSRGSLSSSSWIFFGYCVYPSFPPILIENRNYVRDTVSHKTLSKSSLQIHWISVRFCEMGYGGLEERVPGGVYLLVHMLFFWPWDSKLDRNDVWGRKWQKMVQEQLDGLLLLVFSTYTMVSSIYISHRVLIL